MLRRGRRRVLRRAGRGQSDGDPFPGGLRQVRIDQEGKKKQQADGSVLGAFGPGGRVVSDADQLVPRQADPRDVSFAAA